MRRTKCGHFVAASRRIAVACIFVLSLSIGFGLMQANAMDTRTLCIHKAQLADQQKEPNCARYRCTAKCLNQCVHWKCVSKRIAPR